MAVTLTSSITLDTSTSLKNSLEDPLSTRWLSLGVSLNRSELTAVDEDSVLWPASVLWPPPVLFGIDEPVADVTPAPDLTIALSVLERREAKSVIIAFFVRRTRGPAGGYTQGLLARVHAERGAFLSHLIFL